MIGLVRFETHRGEPAEAILDDVGRWHCPQLPILDRPLNILFDPHRDEPGEAPFGRVALGRVAAWLKGSVVTTEPGFNPESRGDEPRR